MSNASFYSEELNGHRRRLAGIRPRIDSSTPSSYFVLINRAKKDQLLSDWAHNVDTANLALLGRMTAIANTQTFDDHRAVTEERERRHREQSDADRRREAKRIEEENGRMIERLQAQKSNYGTSNWQSHAAAYEKHIREVRLRQMLVADPIGAKKQIAEEKEKARAARKAQKNRKLKPLGGGSGSAAAEVSYERDESGPAEEKEAAEAAAEEERRAGVEVGAFDEVDADELLAADREKSVGSVSLSEWMLPRTSTHTPLHQDSHSIDGRLALLSVDEVNRATARADVPLGDDWSAFTTHPPAFLHAYLLRAYDLDSGLHSHLYLPVQAVAPLAKAIDRRLERIIELLGYTAEGELYFKQSLMPKQSKAKEDNRAARLYVGRRERSEDGKLERKVVEERKRQPAPAVADAKAAKRVQAKPKVKARAQATEEPEAAGQAERPALENDDSTADVEPTRVEAEDGTEQPQAEAAEASEEENYEEDESEAQRVAEQQQEPETAQAEPAEPVKTTEADQSPQPSEPAQQIARAQETETAASSEQTEQTRGQQEQTAETDADEQQTAQQPDIAERANDASDEAQADAASAVEQPADTVQSTQPSTAEKQSEQEEYADDTQPEAQSPVPASQPASNATSPVPTYHKQLASPPTADTNQTEEQPAASKTETAAPQAASPAHSKAAVVEEEKEATPLVVIAPKTPKTPSSAAHQHRAIASPISATKKVASHQNSPRVQAVPATL